MVTTRAAAGTGSSRIGPALLFGGAGILLLRTLAHFTGEARTVLERWVVNLTVVEMVVDVVAGVGAARWYRSGVRGHAPQLARRPAPGSVIARRPQRSPHSTVAR